MLCESVDAHQKAGITMLQNGDHDQALRSFRRTLVGIRQCVTESAAPEEPQGSAYRLHLEQPLSGEEQAIDTEQDSTHHLCNNLETRNRPPCQAHDCPAL
jgi:hypothetical protein